MKIAALEIRPLELPYKKPLITSANRFFKAIGLLVTARSEKGLEGYGYVDVFPRVGETLGSAEYAIENVIKSAVIGRGLLELGAIRQNIDRLLIGNPRVKGGVETALYDLLSRRLHSPLNLLLGGVVKSQVTVIKMVSLADPEEMAQDAFRLTKQGFKALKLKISGELALDIKRVSTVREAVGYGIFIKVDANEAFDAKSAIKLASKLADLDVEIFEQPVPRFHIQSLSEVKKHSPIKIEADQSAGTAMDAYRLVKDRLVDSINTSIMKAGGIQEARRIAEICALGGVECALSNTAGSMVGDAAALQLAASTPGISQLCELGEFEMVSHDPFVGLKVSDGILEVPHGEGIGVNRSSNL